MTGLIQPAPVRRHIVVRAAPQTAFDVFTAGIGRWWPKTKSIGASPQSSVVIEPYDGGRWFEVGEDGAECAWGDVIVWAPPDRLVLAWRLGADWKFHADLLTEVEVRFIGQDDSTTRVELEHRYLERLGDGADRARAAFDSDNGWSGVLSAFALEA